MSVELSRHIKHLRHKIRDMVADYDIRNGAAYGADGKVVFEPDQVHEAVLGTWTKVFDGSRSPPSKPSTSSETCPSRFPPHILSQSSSNLSQVLPSSPVSCSASQKKHEHFVCRPFNNATLARALSKLKTGKARGVDGIPAEVLKYAGPVLRRYLLLFYNKILQTARVPSKLNISKIVLKHKVILNDSFCYLLFVYNFSSREGMFLICSSTGLLPSLHVCSGFLLNVWPLICPLFQS